MNTSRKTDTQCGDHNRYRTWKRNLFQDSAGRVHSNMLMFSSQLNTSIHLLKMPLSRPTSVLDFAKTSQSMGGFFCSYGPNPKRGLPSHFAPSVAHPSSVVTLPPALLVSHGYILVTSEMDRRNQSNDTISEEWSQIYFSWKMQYSIPTKDTNNKPVSYTHLTLPTKA